MQLETERHVSFFFIFYIFSILFYPFLMDFQGGYVIITLKYRYVEKIKKEERK